MTRPTILRIPNPEHTRRVLETRKALRLVPTWEGIRKAGEYVAVVHGEMA